MSEFNDILIKLKDENKRLSEDLNFERNLNNILENIRNNSLILIQNCKCLQNQNTFKVIKQFNSIYTNLKAKQNLLKLNENQNQISITKIKSNDNKSYDYLKTNSTIKAIQQKSVDLKKGKTRQALDKSLKNETENNSDFKSDSNSNFCLITDMFNIKDKNSEELRQMSDILSVNQLKDSQNTTNFHCNECKECFESEDDLEIHVNRVHENSLSFVCTECQQIFNSFIELSTHSSQTHLRRHPPKSCQKSKPKNRSKSNRVNRQTVVDLNSCGRCHKRFNTKQLLLTHSSIVHNIPVFECDLCDYRTERKQTLLRHKEAMHSSDRPYKCPVIGCDKWFKTKHNISAHKKKVHFYFP